MKTILLSVLFLVNNLCTAQPKPVTIIGNMPQQYGGDYVSFSKPIGKYSTNASYISSKDTAVLKNNKFIKTLAVSVPGIIYLFEKPFNGMSSAQFFAAPGDTIVIERQNGKIIFKGKNAIINKMHSDFDSRSDAFDAYIDDIFENNTNADKIIAQINKKEAGYLNSFNDLFLKKEISKSCLEYTKIEIKQKIYCQVMNVFIYDEIRAQIKITKDEANKLADYFNLKYTLNTEENLRTLLFLSTINKRALYLEEQYIKQNKTITRFWNQIDTLFKSVTQEYGIKNIGTIDYIASNDYKEAYIGNFFIDLVESYDNEKTVKYKDLVAAYKTYVEKFPNSSFIIPISEGMMNLALNNLSANTTPAVKVESKIILGSLAIYDKTLESVGTTPFAQPNQSLAEALAEKFPNQDIFIDFWATWCSPCIQQFSYNKELHSFLDSQNIKTLYLSYNKEEDITKWGKYIQDYNLTGYHFLANNSYREKFLEPLSESIPRYFIYNSKTKEMKVLEGFPSEKGKLYTNITKALLTK